MAPPDPFAEEYQTLRQQLHAFQPGLSDAEIDDWIVDAMSAFKICSSDIYVPDGETHTTAMMNRTSTETKIRALKELLK